MILILLYIKYMNNNNKHSLSSYLICNKCGAIL